MSDSIANGFFKCGSSTQNINITTGATQWVGQIGYPIYYEPKVGIGSNATPTSTLQVTGNVYVSNAVTTGFFYGDGSYLTNVGGGQWTGIVPIVTGVASSYTPLATDYYIGVNGTGVTVTLPSGAIAGKTYLIKDESGQITANSSYRVTITGGGLIDGSASIIMTQSYMSLSLLWTGTFWSII